MLGAIAASLAMMALRVFSYHPLFAMPGATKLPFEAATALIIYGLAVVWATAANSGFGRNTLTSATLFGLIGAAIMVADQIVELRLDLASPWNRIVTLIFMLSTFFCWGVSGYCNARGNNPIVAGTTAACWSAIVTMAIVVMVRFAIEFYFAPPKPDYVATWEEFKRSGWTDVNAFTMANTIESALTHLVMGPIVGAIVGAGGGLVKRVNGRNTGDASVRHC